MGIQCQGGFCYGKPRDGSIFRGSKALSDATIGLISDEESGHAG